MYGHLRIGTPGALGAHGAKLDMAMKILIVVVVGAAILAIMNTAMPNLFQSLITKISSELSNVTVLP